MQSADCSPAVEIRNLLNLARRRWSRRLYRRDEAAGSNIGQRIAIKRIVVLVDVLAEINGAIARHPAGHIHSGDRNPVRQVDDLVMAGCNAGIDGGAVPPRHVFKNPGGEIAHIVDARATM